MKTAIYIPDDIFRLAEMISKNLKLSRSELYSRAIKEYVRDFYSENITRKLNAVYGDSGDDSKIGIEIYRAQLNVLEKEESISSY
jgi:metal-responsive CopG/Arc/MetJ family transcriptional regulator